MKPITWLCCKCGEPIANKQGYVEVLAADLRKAQMAQMEEERIRVQERASFPRFKTGREILSEPDTRAHWRAIHRDCDPGDAEGYWFGVERCRTVESLLSWTLHLLGKGWYEATDWTQFADEAWRALRTVAPRRSISRSQPEALEIN